LQPEICFKINDFSHGYYQIPHYIAILMERLNDGHPKPWVKKNHAWSALTRIWFALLLQALIGHDILIFQFLELADLSGLKNLSPQELIFFSIPGECE